MVSRTTHKTLASAAVALLLAAPTMAATPRLVDRGCLANAVPDLSCADSSTAARCISTEGLDAGLFVTCLEAAGCTPDEAENALRTTEECWTAPSSSSSSSSSDDTRAASEAGLRRRSLHGRRGAGEMLARADATSTGAGDSATATSTSASATSTSSSSSSSSSKVNIGLSSAIVGTTMGVVAVLAFGGMFVLCWRDGAAARRAKREAAQKEALLANMG